MDAATRPLGWPSYVISLGPAEFVLLLEDPGTASLALLQTHPAVLWTTGCHSEHRSWTENRKREDINQK